MPTPRSGRIAWSAGERTDSVNPPAQSNFQNLFPRRAKWSPSSPESVPGLIPQKRPGDRADEVGQSLLHGVRREGRVPSDADISSSPKRTRLRWTTGLPGSFQELFPNRSPASRAHRTAPGARTPVPRQAPGDRHHPHGSQSVAQASSASEATTEGTQDGDRSGRHSKKYRNGDDQVAPVLRARNHTRRRLRRNEVTRDRAVVRLHAIVCGRPEPREVCCSRQGEGTHDTHQKPSDLDPGMCPAGIAPRMRWNDEILTVRRPGCHPTIFTQGISAFRPWPQPGMEPGRACVVRRPPTGRSARGTRRGRNS